MIATIPADGPAVTAPIEDTHTPLTSPAVEDITEASPSFPEISSRAYIWRAYALAASPPLLPPSEGLTRLESRSLKGVLKQGN